MQRRHYERDVLSFNVKKNTVINRKRNVAKMILAVIFAS